MVKVIPSFRSLLWVNLEFPFIEALGSGVLEKVLVLFGDVAVSKDERAGHVQDMPGVARFAAIAGT